MFSSEAPSSPCMQQCAKQINRDIYFRYSVKHLISTCSANNKTRQEVKLKYPLTEDIILHISAAANFRGDLNLWSA